MGGPSARHDAWEAFMEMERRRVQQHAQGSMARAIGYALAGESQEESDRIASEDQRLSQRGLVGLKTDGECHHKHIEELTREDRTARIAAERETVDWLKERVKSGKQGTQAPPIPTHLR